jgi:hypothetical protein
MATNEELPERLARTIARADGYKALTPLKYHGLADAVLAEFPELRHEPPEGCEWVALPTETVDYVVSVGSFCTSRAEPSVHIYPACRDTVARRPQPVVETERVPWWEALSGRRQVIGWDLTGVHEGLGSPPCLVSDEADRDGTLYREGKTYFVQPDLDGTVEVLIEPGGAW